MSVNVKTIIADTFQYFHILNITVKHKIIAYCFAFWVSVRSITSIKLILSTDAENRRILPNFILTNS